MMEESIATTPTNAETTSTQSSPGSPDAKEPLPSSSPDTNSSGVKSSSINDDETFEDEERELVLLSPDVIEEEEKCMKETEQAISQLAQNRVILAANEKAKRYKNLMTLLGKSSQYASYMSQKLIKEKKLNAPSLKSEEGDALKEISQNTNSNGKRKQSQQSGATKKLKINDTKPLAVNTNVPEGHYRNKAGLIVSNRQPKLLCGGVMRDYQLDGLEWLVTLYKNAVNGILADEMGLGKTIQIISLICHLREKNIFGPHVIIAPFGTLTNWISEFAVFAPDVPVMLFHGDQAKRHSLKHEFTKLMRGKDDTKVPVILTSYEMPLRESRFFTKVPWCYSIVDEGHRLKNYHSLLSIELRQYKTESRLLLTGTPLQNNLIELWSLLNYLIPEIFDDLPMFESLFDFSDLNNAEKQDQLIQQEKEEKIISKMHEILEPFLLRRLKSDVSLEVPRKKEVLVYAPLAAEQEKLYKLVIDKNIRDEVEEEKETSLIIEGKRNRKSTQRYEDVIPCNVFVDSTGKHFYCDLKLNATMQLRKVANHPYLVKCPVIPGTVTKIIEEDMIPKSGKLLVLDALLPKLKERGHKVLLFSTFTIMLNLIEEYVKIRHYKYERLDGSCKIQDRLESIKRFNSDPETFVFLLSTRAGGLGINLTAADTVIIFDSDWNPQVDLQAQDRCHRIGQTRPVVVYRLVTKGTVDQRIVDVAVSKRRLEKLVVKKGKFKQQGQEEALSIGELKELFNSTDHTQVIHPNGLVLSEEQIENLLDRSDLID